VCLHAAVREGLPRVVVQYAIAGKPIVCTALPGVDSLISEGANGKIAPLDDIGAFAAPLRAVLEKLDPYQAEARERAVTYDYSRWDHREMVARIETVYQQTTKSKWHRFPKDQLVVKPE